MAEKSAWHTITVKDSDTDEIFVIRESFSSEGYTIEASNFVQVWSESLNRGAIIKRADEQECCIDPVERDQFKILLDHISSAIHSKAGAEVSLRRNEAGLELQIMSELPDPLPNLQWCCSLNPLPAGCVKTHLFMPLLGSMHVMKVQVDELSRLVLEKDRTMNRILEKLDSNRIDLSSIFPISSSKMTLSRQKELINEHVQGMRPFKKDDWLAKIDSASDTTLSYLDLLNEAFSQSGSRRVRSLVEFIEHSSARKSPRVLSIAKTPDKQMNSPERVEQKSTALGFQERNQASRPSMPSGRTTDNMKKEPRAEIGINADAIDDASTTDDELDDGPPQNNVSDHVKWNGGTTNEAVDVRPTTATSGASTTASELSSDSRERRIGVIGGQPPAQNVDATQQENAKATEIQPRRRLGEIGGTGSSAAQNGSKNDSSAPARADRADADNGDASGRNSTETEEKEGEKTTEERREELKRELEHKSRTQHTKKKRRF